MPKSRSAAKAAHGKTKDTSQTKTDAVRFII
jgi:hypothetical protein